VIPDPLLEGDSARRLEVAHDADSSLAQTTGGRSLAADAWRRFRRNKLAMFGLILVVALLLIAIIGPFLVQDPTKLAKINMEPPTSQHPFGLDQRGGDVLARVVYGIRLSLMIGFLATFMETVIGIIVGALAGWAGGWIDSILMRFVDVVLGIPYILLAFAFITVFGKGVPSVILTLAFTAWLQTARVVRAGFLQAKELDYVEAARALGVPSRRIMRRHILPNVFQPIIILIAIGIGSAILAEAALSFLNVGVKYPQPSLGLMISESQGFFSTAPYLLFFPGLAIALTVLGFLLVGDGLRDALDVKDI
jgi:ABC-type dipeptide/oligopeptide/nickel transport system permease subunit